MVFTLVSPCLLRLADVSVLGTLTGVGFGLVTVFAVVLAESNGFPDARTEYYSSIFLRLYLPALFIAVVSEVILCK
jgi:hypothetical protein